MPIRGGWYIEDYVMLIESYGVLTTSEYMQSVEQGAEEFRVAAGDHPIHVIVDQTRMTVQPNLQDLMNGNATDIRQGWTIIVMEDNPLHKFQTSVTTQKFQFETRFAENITEAKQIIEATVPEVKGQFPSIDAVRWVFEYDESAFIPQ